MRSTSSNGGSPKAATSSTKPKPLPEQSRRLEYTEVEMIDHVYISVTEIERSFAFYTAALQPLGWSPFGNYDSASGPADVPGLYGIGDNLYGSGEAVGASIRL